MAAENDALTNGKVGGIGDVIRDIPQVLANRCDNVDVIVPGYRFHSQINEAELALTLNVPFCNNIERVELYKLTHINGKDNVTQWVLEHDLFACGGKGKIYCDDDANSPFASDATKFALFSAAVCELLCHEWHERIQVIHLHDWHAALIAVLRAYDLRYQALQHVRCVYSIHNLALQGIRPLSGDASSMKTWFPYLTFDHRMVVDPRYQNCINPTRAGITLSDAVHVVSPTYATEVIKASSPEHGFVGGEGLEIDLINAANENRLFGILNGCDYSEKENKTKVTPQTLNSHIENTLFGWIAKERVLLSAHFIAMNRIKHWQESAKNLKKSTSDKAPLVTSIGRLTDQKMAILMLSHGATTVLDELLVNLNEHNGRLIILGSGDAKIEQQLTKAMHKHANLLFLNGYCDALSQDLYQLGDLFLMPSSFEPCGISQMLAMRAGQPCLVHSIGGLADTVTHNETGFSFSGDGHEQQSTALLHAFEQTISLFEQDKAKWNNIANAAKSKRFDWQDSIDKYLSELY